jgi:hypothetical protein
VSASVSFSTVVRTSRKGHTVALFQRICCFLFNQRADQLHAVNYFIANRRVTLPASARSILGNETSTLARQRDQSQWRALAA